MDEHNIFCMGNRGLRGPIPARYYYINEGFDVNKREENNSLFSPICKGDTALHVACRNCYLLIVQYLIEKGTNIEANLWKTPLHFACQYGHLPIVQYLIDKSAHIETKDKDEQNPLHIACRNGHTLISFEMEKNIAGVCNLVRGK